ncbi:MULTISPECIES: winged helix-turn-helix domain-containing protein [unclassified Methanoculleus]|mgnify:CR=1 FL=1|jgi:DNA-binding transcriptional ArsR family regulator|uniref:winged helix-turn-helix domain-containing protein n=1 Tax=unclassified Methanoculleus TaxID=2619537 RepID=UPI0025F85DB5|nr:winged helix-turn-helix domain-containing protein [Methanoculleus sp. UBA377]MDD2473091.1 winged helix-turn-helix domain-containing protein [Methanoculleus sp.]
MEPVDIVLTKDTFEVLASGTRLDILKALRTRRMTVTELADDLDLAKSTVHHHLQRLADAGFVAAGEDGHAWVYYALTPAGRALLQPHGSARVRIILTAGLASLAGGVAALAAFLTAPVREVPIFPRPGGGGLPVPEGPPVELLIAGIALVLVGGFLVGYACIRRRNTRAAGSLPADGKSV